MSFDVGIEGQPKSRNTSFEIAKIRDASVAELLRAADVDGNGRVSVAEVAEVLRTKIRAVRTSTHLKMALLAVLFVCIFQNGTLLGVMSALFIAFKDTRIVGNGELADFAGNIVQTTPHKIAVPLIVAPVLPKEQLDSLDMVSMTLTDFPGVGMSADVKYTVHGYHKFSDVYIVFQLSGNCLLTIKDGKATFTQKLIRENDGTTDWTLRKDWHLTVCAALASCSAFMVRTDEEADALLNKALEELCRADADVCEEARARRQLSRGASWYERPECLNPNPKPDWTTSGQAFCANSRDDFVKNGVTDRRLVDEYGRHVLALPKYGMCGTPCTWDDKGRLSVCGPLGGSRKQVNFLNGGSTQSQRETNTADSRPPDYSTKGSGDQINPGSCPKGSSPCASAAFEASQYQSDIDAWNRGNQIGTRRWVPEFQAGEWTTQTVAEVKCNFGQPLPEGTSCATGFFEEYFNTYVFGCVNKRQLKVCREECRRHTSLITREPDTSCSDPANPAANEKGPQNLGAHKFKTCAEVMRSITVKEAQEMCQSADGPGTATPCRQWETETSSVQGCDSTLVNIPPPLPRPRVLRHAQACGPEPGRRRRTMSAAPFGRSSRARMRSSPTTSSTTTTLAATTAPIRGTSSASSRSPTRTTRRPTGAASRWTPTTWRSTFGCTLWPTTSAARKGAARRGRAAGGGGGRRISACARAVGVQ